MFYIIFLIAAAVVVFAVWLIKKETSKTKEISSNYVSKELYLKVESDFYSAKDEIKEKAENILNLNKEVSAKNEIINNLGEKLENQKKDIESLQAKMTLEFENIANRVLDDRSNKFLKTSSDNISGLLVPLKEKITDFRKRVDEIYSKDIEERTDLKKEIEHLRQLNKQLSDDANNLADALKGENKTQGNWGEVQLEMLLERVGLLKGVHYKMQESFNAESGSGRLQPDCIVNLPDNKHLIIDSKVSLVDFEKYFNAETDEERQRFSKRHLQSIETHIKQLSKKDYQNLYGINSPDYVLMFLAYESAVVLAVKENPEIFQQALDKNIVLVSGSTLLATLKTVSYIWKQENQKTYVLEIAKQGGMLYDKFVLFVEDLKKIGSGIDQTNAAFESAMNKLTKSVKKGDTLVGRAEKIRELGARVSKKLPQDILDKAEINQEHITDGS